MGAWGYGVTESDDALDAIGCFEDISTSRELQVEAVDKVHGMMDYTSFQYITCAIAHKLMEEGVQLHEEVARRAIEEAGRGCSKSVIESEGWDDPGKRRIALQRFRDAVDDYTKGREVELTDRGLIATMFES